jgi:rhodanese-related sulfurtransferase
MNIFGRSYRSVSVPIAKELVKQGHILIDVRSDKEWRSGHAPEAHHIPLDALVSRLGELPQGTPVVTLCHSGVRSARAAQTLAKHGYTVASVRGGMIAWNHAR